MSPWLISDKLSCKTRSRQDFSQITKNTLLILLIAGEMPVNPAKKQVKIFFSFFYIFYRRSCVEASRTLETRSLTKSAVATPNRSIKFNLILKFNFSQFFSKAGFSKQSAFEILKWVVFSDVASAQPIKTPHSRIKTPRIFTIERQWKRAIISRIETQNSH